MLRRAGAAVQVLDGRRRPHRLRVERHELEIVAIVCVRSGAHTLITVPASACRSFANPERIRVLTVPTGCLNCAATSL